MADTGASDNSKASTPALEDQGEWEPFRCCRLDCSATCINYALVVDGQVVRVKTDDRFEDTEEMPQQRGCVRGQARIKTVYGADRLKYPMKRKNWEPGGGKKELRGRDEWVRISWDEALDIVASEIQRIIDKYGVGSIYRAGMYTNPVLASVGGSYASAGGNSLDGWVYPARCMTGFPNLNSYYGDYLYNDRLSWVKSKLIVLWGNNPSWSCHGYPNKILVDAKRNGAKIIGINPFCNDTISSIGDQWIPIRPGTDTAMLLACAYVMITNDLQDQDFLDRCTIGFDADHMPEGADPKDNFKDYVLGTYDGVPKTPEWAYNICGVDPQVITDFAKEIATTKPAALITCSAATRIFRGEQFAQAFFTVGWMTGNVGKDGAMVSDNSQKLFGNGGLPLMTPGANGKPVVLDPISEVFNYYNGVAPENGLWGIPIQGRWDAVLNGEYMDGKWGMKKVDIQMIWDIGRGNKLQTDPGLPKGIEAFRKVEFVVSADCWFTLTAQYADVVLPEVMQWEYPDNFSPTSNRETLTYCSKVIEPLFETKDDCFINVELAKRLGIDPAAIELSEEEVFCNQLAGAGIMKEDGTDYETMFTITKEDWAELGQPDREPQTGRVEWQQFKKDGIYQLPRQEGDNYGYIALEDFVRDPEANPVATESGKLEIYCQSLSYAVDCFGSYHVDPIAKYVAPEEGYETTFSDFEKRVPGKYPLLMNSPHYPHHNAAQFASNVWLREAWSAPIYMNPLDAEARGLKSEDVVRCYNDRGAVLRQVKLTPRVMPGNVLLPDGQWSEIDPETGIDVGGNPNMLTSTAYNGADVQPWNSINVEIEKWDGDYTPDHVRPLVTDGLTEE